MLDFNRNWMTGLKFNNSLLAHLLIIGKPSQLLLQVLNNKVLILKLTEELLHFRNWSMKSFFFKLLDWHWILFTFVLIIIILENDVTLIWLSSISVITYINLASKSSTTVIFLVLHITHVFMLFIYQIQMINFCLQISLNLFQILAVEWLTANRALSFRQGEPGFKLLQILEPYRSKVRMPDGDAYWSPLLAQTRVFMEQAQGLDS